MLNVYSISFECQHFGVAEPQFTSAEELKADISQHETMWGLYEEFSNGLDELAKEDWISFRYLVALEILQKVFRQGMMLT